MNIRKSIKGTLLLFAFCISLIPVVTITTLYFFHARSTIRYQILEELRAITESKRLHILSFMEAKRIRTSDFSSDGFIRKSFKNITRAETSKHHEVMRLNRYLLKNKLTLNRHLLAIILLNKYGKVISSTHERLIGKDFSNQDTFIQGIGKSYGETWVGQPQYSPYFDKDCIFVSAPVISKQKAELLGVIMNVYGLASLNEITANNPIGTGESGETYLVNRDKIMFTESRFVRDASLKQVVDTEPVRKVIGSGMEMVGIYKDYRGILVIGASSYIPEYGWILISEIDKSEAFAPLKTLGIIALILELVSVVAVTIAGVIFAVSTSKPIESLTKATERFARGN